MKLLVLGPYLSFLKEKMCTRYQAHSALLFWLQIQRITQQQSVCCLFGFIKDHQIFPCIRGHTQIDSFMQNAHWMFSKHPSPSPQKKSELTINVIFDHEKISYCCFPAYQMGLSDYEAVSDMLSMGISTAVKVYRQDTFTAVKILSHYHYVQQPKV